MIALLALALWLATAIAHLVVRKSGARSVDWDDENGIEIAQGLALAAFGIFATIAVFGVLEALGISLVQALFNQLMP